MTADKSVDCCFLIISYVLEEREQILRSIELILKLPGATTCFHLQLVDIAIIVCAFMGVCSGLKSSFLMNRFNLES